MNFAKFLRTPFLRNTSRRLLLWFKSYLTDQKQSVLINSFNSNVSTIMSGIPPGSVLGSLVFLIYINDLNIAIKNCKVHYLADNTNLLNIKKLRRRVNKAINVQSLYISKTEMVPFRPKRNCVVFK